MANVLLYYLIVINAVTFLVYGIDKVASKRGKSQTRLSFSGRTQARPKVKLRRGGRQPPLRNKESQNFCPTLLYIWDRCFDRCQSCQC